MTFDDVISPEDCDYITKYSDTKFNDGYGSIVDIPKFASFWMYNITQAAICGEEEEPMKIQKLSSIVFAKAWKQYQERLGILQDERFKDTSHNYTESFFLRYYPDGGFENTHFGARCSETGRRFATMILCLNDAKSASIAFEPEVGAANIQYKKGRLVIFPSNWMFPFREIQTDESRYCIQGHYAWYDPDKYNKVTE